jgi:hypothetical protein
MPVLIPMPIFDRAVAGALAAGVVFVEFVDHAERTAQGRIRRIRKERHDGIADVFVDNAAMGRDDRLHLHQVGVQEVEVLLRTHGLRQGGEVADVREQNGHLALDLMPELHFADVVEAEQIEKTAGNEATVGHFRIAQRLADRARRIDHAPCRHWHRHGRPHAGGQRGRWDWRYGWRGTHLSSK